MMNISMFQALMIWSELEQAYYGDNKYHGDTAEIHTYRLDRDDPKMSLGANDVIRKEALRESGIRTARSLYNLIDLFCQTRECHVTVDGEHYKVLLERPLSHRCYVTVRHRRGY